MGKDQLQAYLRDRGMTYAQIAQELGVGVSAVQKIVNGETTRGTSRYAFAKAVGLEVEDIWPAPVAA